eukprot:m.59881 g.59881  ORF g.59881 m.59881 type:complete len:617 (+) comp7925_c0_seq8:297-2147(+)
MLTKHNDIVPAITNQAYNNNSNKHRRVKISRSKNMGENTDTNTIAKDVDCDMYSVHSPRDDDDNGQLPQSQQLDESSSCCNASRNEALLLIHSIEGQEFESDSHPSSLTTEGIELNKVEEQERKDCAGEQLEDEPIAALKIYEKCDELDDLLPNKVIINYLPTSVSESDLFDMFSSFGKITSHVLMRNRGTGQSLGYGFIEYENGESATKAIDQRNGIIHEDKRLKVSYARPSGVKITRCNLFVKGLPKSITGETFRAMFSQYGEIVSTRLLTSKEGDLKGTGFVRYANRSSATEAIKGLNGTKTENDDDDSLLTVKFADASPSSSPLEKTRNPTPQQTSIPGRSRYNNKNSNYSTLTTPQHYYYAADMELHIPSSAITPQGICLFVLNFPSYWKESDLVRAFSKYGSVSACAIKNKFKQSGKLYCFLTMTNGVEAMAAIDSLNGALIEGYSIQVNFKGEPVDQQRRWDSSSSSSTNGSRQSYPSTELPSSNSLHHPPFSMVAVDPCYYPHTQQTLKRNTHSSTPIELLPSAQQHQQHLPFPGVEYSYYVAPQYHQPPPLSHPHPHPQMHPPHPQFYSPYFHPSQPYFQQSQIYYSQHTQLPPPNHTIQPSTTSSN